VRSDSTVALALLFDTAEASDARYMASRLQREPRFAQFAPFLWGEHIAGPGNTADLGSRAKWAEVEALFAAFGRTPCWEQVDEVVINFCRDVLYNTEPRPAICTRCHELRGIYQGLDVCPSCVAHDGPGAPQNTVSPPIPEPSDEDDCDDWGGGVEVEPIFEPHPTGPEDEDDWDGDGLTEDGSPSEHRDRMRVESRYERRVPRDGSADHPDRGELESLRAKLKRACDACEHLHAEKEVYKRKYLDQWSPEEEARRLRDCAAQAAASATRTREGSEASRDLDTNDAGETRHTLGLRPAGTHGDSQTT
jgi:hypothetical protein